MMMERSAPSSKLGPGTGLALSATVFGFFLGALLGKATASPSDGLAGAATVLFFGLGCAVLFVVLAIALVRKLTRAVVVRCLWFAGPLALLLVGWSIKRFVDLKAVQDEQWQQEQQRMRRMKPAIAPALFHFASWTGSSTAGANAGAHEPVMGLGMLAPRMEAGTWRMFAAPVLFDPLHWPPVVDSLLFAPGPYHMDIAYAPPWFAPAHIKLDYDLLMLRVITLAPGWVEVMVNEADGRTAWVVRTQGEVRLWPEFMLGVAAVEIIDPASNPIRVKPLDHASVLADGADALLAPLAVQGDWLLVRTHALADRIQPTGWVRWRKEGVLLVEYSLLC